MLESGLEEGRIEADVESLEMLGNNWIAAREYSRAVEPLSRAAALSEDGALFVRLAQVHMQREQWREASALLRKALDKGGLDDPGNIQLLLGICYYSDERMESARSSFLRAKRHASTRSEASAWLMHVEREIQQAELNGAMNSPVVLHPAEQGADCGDSGVCPSEESARSSAVSGVDRSAVQVQTAARPRAGV